MLAVRRRRLLKTESGAIRTKNACKGFKKIKTLLRKYEWDSQDMLYHIFKVSFDDTM